MRKTEQVFGFIGVSVRSYSGLPLAIWYYSDLFGFGSTEVELGRCVFGFSLGFPVAGGVIWRYIIAIIAYILKIIMIYHNMSISCI